MHSKEIISAGKKLSEAKKALVMIHGRGGSAQDVLSLASHLNVEEYALFAPQATGNTWYPNSFLVNPKQNEPGLSSALEVLKDLLKEIKAEGISSENIYFLGFSQGACLALEFVTRNAQQFGGVVALTGGLIGDKIYTGNYTGDFSGTPVFIGTGNPDAHVPVERVQHTAEVLQKMNAEVTVEVYDNKPHSISQDEIQKANSLIFK